MDEYWSAADKQMKVATEALNQNIRNIFGATTAGR
jgi:hypothetical protein